MANNEIVVGVDGSPASRSALRWAVELAATTGAPVTAVEVGYPVTVAHVTAFTPMPYGTAPPLEQARPSPRLYDLVVAARAGVWGAPEVRRLHVDGDPGAELTRLAESAAMLVIGKTRHSRLAEFVLGSVGAHCLRHARCPVVTVPA
ncbi:universal stress protein [Actinokineospora sp. HBU206404]|uniref:Universal stress protein n=2 Tax=Actinokineospora xionganensis TaxID=2684470 RepID=A0ABR7KZP3_9PSEU|nr:universal stress protein [Actinokineospora xionganensis]